MCIALGAATHCPSSLPHHLSPSGCRLCTEERPLSTLHSLMNRGLRCCRQFVACRAAGRLQPPGARLRTCGRSDQRRYTTPHLPLGDPACHAHAALARGVCVCGMAYGMQNGMVGHLRRHPPQEGPEPRRRSSWCSWLSHSPHTREVSSSILDDDILRTSVRLYDTATHGRGRGPHASAAQTPFCALMKLYCVLPCLPYERVVGIQSPRTCIGEKGSTQTHTLFR
jgi:hypothetical protein